MTLFCRDCGASLAGYPARTQYCKECRRARDVLNRRANEKKNKLRRAEEAHINKMREDAAKRDTLTNICKAARAAGMSYGEYVSKYGV